MEKKPFAYDQYGRRFSYGVNKVESLIPIPRLRSIAPSSEIANEFRFLDDRPMTPIGSHPTPYFPSAQFSDTLRESEITDRSNNLPVQSSNNFKLRNPVITIIVPVIQICFAIGILVYGIIDFSKNYQLTSTFIDFDRCLGMGNIDKINQILPALSGSFCILPALLQIIAAIAAIASIFSKFNIASQVLHILFSTFAILFWFKAVFITSYLLNSMNGDNSLSDWYYVYLVLLAIVALILPTIMIVPFANSIYKTVASLHEIQFSIDSKKRLHTVLHVSTAALPVIFSAVIIGIAIPLVKCSAGKMPEWVSMKTTESIEAVMLYGLKELIIASYILLLSFADFVCLLLKPKTSRFTSVLLFSISLLILIMYLVNGESTFTTINNYRILANHKNDLPISHLIFLFLHIFVCLLTVSVAANIISNILLLTDTRKVPTSGCSIPIDPFEYPYRTTF